MDLRPGALIGIPAGVPSVVFDVAYWRVLLVVIAVATGWVVARRRGGWAVALAIAWAGLAIAFWTFASARPYGLLQDPAITTWAAEVSVAGQSPGEDGFVAGEPPRHRRWFAASRRAPAGIGVRALLLAPTMLPLALYPAVALLIAVLWRGPEKALAAILWLAAVCGDLDVVRGTGLLPALWPAPATGIAVAGAIAVALAAGRWLPAGAAVAAGAVVAILAAVVPGPRTPIAPAELPGVLVFDAVAWVVLGVVGLRSRRDPAALALAAGAGTALAAASLGGADAVVAAALYRTGLILAATPVIAEAAARAAAALRVPRPGGGTWSPDGAAVRGFVVAVTLAGSFVTWWDPPRMDPRARMSLDAMPDAVTETMDWIRANTDPGGVFIAGEDYAPAVAVLGGRRVLRAPSLHAPGDDQRRVRTQRRILTGRRVESLVDRYGVRYVLTAPAQFRDLRLEEPWGIESQTGEFPIVFRGRSGLRVYEVPP